MSQETPNWMKNRMTSLLCDDQSTTSNPVVPKDNQENDGSLMVTRRGPKEEPPEKFPHYLRNVGDHWEPIYDDDNDDSTLSKDSISQSSDSDDYPDEPDGNSYAMESFIEQLASGKKHFQSSSSKKEKKSKKSKGDSFTKDIEENNDIDYADFGFQSDSSYRSGRSKQPPVAVLAKQLADATTFITTRTGAVYHYDEKDHYYKPVNVDKAIELFSLYVDPNLNGALNLRNHSDILRCLRMNPSLKYDEPSKKKVHCSLKNCVFFTKTGKMESNSPKIPVFTSINAKYNEKADCPSFRKFLDDVSGGREDIKERILMAMGYLLVEPAKGKFFFIAGYAPNSGKSLFFNFIQRLFPPESISNLSLNDLGGHFELESLLSSRINFCLDLPIEPLNATAVSKLKQITGGDTLEVSRKGTTSQKLDHQVKLVFSSNAPLKLKSNDPAFWDRVVFLPFLRSVPKCDRQTNLASKFWKERNGIVTLALKYAQKLEELDFQFPPIPEDDLNGSKQKLPLDFLQDFFDSNCEVGDYNNFCSSTIFNKAYIQYCDENGFVACSRQVVNQFLAKQGGVHDRSPLIKGGNSVYGFYGIKLLPESSGNNNPDSV